MGRGELVRRTTQQAFQQRGGDPTDQRRIEANGTSAIVESGRLKTETKP
jgi:hypothetical protein